MSCAAEPGFLLREPAAGDFPFVVRSWLEHYREESYHARRVRNEVYYRRHHDLLVDLIGRSQTLIAAGRQDPDAIYGYVVFELSPAALHWIYVKRPFRGLGIGRALFGATGLPQDLAGVIVSHPTRSWFSSRAAGPGYEARYPAAIHDPYAGYPRPLAPPEREVKWQQ